MNACQQSGTSPVLTHALVANSSDIEAQNTVRLSVARADSEQITHTKGSNIHNSSNTKEVKVPPVVGNKRLHSVSSNTITLLGRQVSLPEYSYNYTRRVYISSPSLHTSPHLTRLEAFNTPVDDDIVVGTIDINSGNTSSKIAAPRIIREHTPILRYRQSVASISTPEAVSRFDQHIKENLPLHMHNIPLPTKPKYALESVSRAVELGQKSEETRNTR
ncbi:hypothetical protein SARC_11185 [Sphaeroforma arctica JP610]|uniref:Uncharacterized protein n=1 Tax=Sphaeroforma arctica JP610 TaxID=667725 RepID=A0A0L0FJU8_9EUKA|nr:hypothetical protein SARC_11185 [Sphaeroforma arctica JP610]KNC76308.1 hypothetical protein SARC_11185 [Sphaeroforma arctica JP610]|eukprot:XP_014150210.1 hypothetical protein SARC_11185 [Sphaeroforma arctica JP610]